MSLSQLEEENKFKKHLGEYWASKGITQIKIPQIGGQQLNLFRLYKTVCKKGGGQSVSHNKLWKQIVDQFGLPSTCTSASFTLKNHYQKYLLGYEQRFFFGKDDSADLPELVAGRQRKPMKMSQGFHHNNLAVRYSTSSNERQIAQSSSLSSELKKYYEKADPSQMIHYLKRTKIYPVMAEVKHLMMALQSTLPQEIIYAINILTLFSVNSQAPFLFSQYPFILQSITSYLHRTYPPSDVFQMECLRNLTLALRNLLINHKNLQAVLESELLQVLYQMLEERKDRQVTRNVANIFSSLTRVGFDCKELFGLVQLFLQKDAYQDIQTGIDLLRSVVEQRQELCQKIIQEKIDFFSRLLVYSSMQVRQAILDIIAYLSDKSQRIRLLLVSHQKFMERLFAHLSYSQGNFQRQAQLSCYILNNIFQMQNPQVLSVFHLYERTLMLVSFNDQGLSPITSAILYRLSGGDVGDGKEREKEAMEAIRKNINRQQMEEQEQESSSQYAQQ